MLLPKVAPSPGPISAPVTSFTVSVSMLDESRPKDVAGKEFSGMRFTGESGEDEGEGSESEEVSVVSVVVGEDSADSEFWVDVLSRCRCMASLGLGRACWGCRCCGFCCLHVVSVSMRLESTTATMPLLSSYVSAKGSSIDMNEGIWSS
jgi:hypothetical protein